MPPFTPLFAYISPDTFLPVTSILAAVVGFVMMFGRTAIRYARGLVSSWIFRTERVSMTPKPHIRARSRTRTMVEE